MVRALVALTKEGLRLSEDSNQSMPASLLSSHLPTGAGRLSKGLIRHWESK